MKSKKKVSKSKSKKKVVKKRTSKRINKSNFEVDNFPSVQIQNYDANSYVYTLNSESPIDESDLLQDGLNTVEEEMVLQAKEEKLNDSEKKFQDKLNRAVKKEKSNFLVRAWIATVDFFWGE